jgi:hypothetical protein
VYSAKNDVDMKLLYVDMQFFIFSQMLDSKTGAVDSSVHMVCGFWFVWIWFGGFMGF